MDVGRERQNSRYTGINHTARIATVTSLQLGEQRSKKRRMERDINLTRTTTSNGWEDKGTKSSNIIPITSVKRSSSEKGRGGDKSGSRSSQSRAVKEAVQACTTSAPSAPSAFSTSFLQGTETEMRLARGNDRKREENPEG
ncbi:hypothetical protein PoB_005770700 [Plakobranchus ocellatus]|uniref:Uncharacterized protein n=1 Tax=Plakobranchus ocellatus TaxID=259542 RepID=A0AAV4CIM7_9GAST|nr:hypothetical protein PoB_005770700 [Plakobranchus ocellatus]